MGRKVSYSTASPWISSFKSTLVAVCSNNYHYSSLDKPIWLRVSGLPMELPTAPQNKPPQLSKTQPFPHVQKQRLQNGFKKKLKKIIISFGFVTCFIPTRFHNPLGALGRRSLTWTGSRSSPEISPGTSMEEACGDTALQRQQGSLQPILGSMDDVGISVYILYIYMHVCNVV